MNMIPEGLVLLVKVKSTGEEVWVHTGRKGLESLQLFEPDEVTILGSETLLTLETWETLKKAGLEISSEGSIS